MNAVFYKAKANKPATTAAPLTNFCAAAPVNLGAGGLVPVELGPPVEPVELATMTKFAQVNLVALAVWMTIDRFPKNVAGPCWVEV